jgi:hypothetical protein
MCSHCWNKLIAISSALAAAGILACAGALLDAFIPRGSVLGFLTWMVVLGIIVIGTVVGYTWVCDKCEGYFNGRLDRLLSRSKPKPSDAVNPAAAVRQRPTDPKVVGDARSTPDTRQLFSCARYTPTLRGAVLSRDATTKGTAVRTWHGQ